MAGLLRAPLPDWHALLAAADRARRRGASVGRAAWAEKGSLGSAFGLRKGEDHDIWQIDGGFCLCLHPGLLDRLFGWLFMLIDRLFVPLRRLRERIDAFIVHLAARMGTAFALISIPLALVALVADTLALFIGLLRTLPSLLLSPFALIRTIVAIPFRLVAALLSRLVRTLLLAWVARWLETPRGIDELLRRYPWLRGMILGFLRRERPDYPVLIPARSISQVLHATRRGIFGSREYLVIVEGAPLQAGIGAWLALKIKQVALPFYWERTVHMLLVPNELRQPLTLAVSNAAGKRVRQLTEALQDVVERVNVPAGLSAPAADEEQTAAAWPASATDTQEAVPPAGETRRLWRAAAVAAIVVAALAGGLWFLRSREAGENREETVTERSAPLVGGRGSLRVDVNVPAKATLDGWHLPDTGAQAASALVFSNVEATTHTLEVSSEGYRRESSNVVVKANQTSRIAVDLRRAR